MEEISIPFSQPRHVRRDFYPPLFRAILEDNWEAAEAFIQNDRTKDCLKAAITTDQGTALHFAVAAKRIRFVKELVKLMESEDLELKNNRNYTALYFAAQSGIVTIAEEMVKKNKNLPLIPKDDIQCLPLYAAIIIGNRDMVSYLYRWTRIEELALADRIKLLNATISNDLYDTALKILDILKPATEEIKNLWDPMKMLAKKTSKIGSKSQPSVWERNLNSVFRGWFCNKAMMQASAHKLVDQLLELLQHDSFLSPLDDHMLQHHKQLVVEATKVGNVEFLIILVSTYPDLIWQVDEEYGTLFHVAVEYRQQRVFNLIYKIGGLKNNLATYKAKGGNNMLHLAGQLPSSDRLNIETSGQKALLTLQQELWWFQEIEKIVPKSFVNQPNESEETPQHIYVRTHKKLQKNGEKWMKEKADSCMLVATLIATLGFTAAFTVPGGNNQETGIPIFLECNRFTLFFISDIVAMVFSSSSMLVFLSIVYSENDFFKPLPDMMAFGVVMLSISIVAMLTAFITACFLVFQLNTIASISLIGGTCLIVCRPFWFHVKLYYKLLVGILQSLHYSLGFRFRSHNRLFKARKQLGKE